MTSKKSTELLGATQGKIDVTTAGVTTLIHLEPSVRGRLVQSLLKADKAARPDRVFLNIENVKSNVDSATFHVFVEPPGTPPGVSSSLRKAGNISLFGVRKASDPAQGHGGQGLTLVLEITRIVDELHAARSLEVDALEVRLVPANTILPSAKITIGRISVVRQEER